MVQLPETKVWTGDGWNQNPRILKLVKRSKTNAVYSIFDSKTNKLRGYEVFNIKVVKKGQQIFNAVAEDDIESYPAKNSFGKSAWSVLSLEKANEIYNRLEKETQSQTVVDMSEIDPDPIIPLVKRSRGRPKIYNYETSKYIIPDNPFTTNEFAALNNISYPLAYLFIKEQMDKNSIILSHKENFHKKGKPTSFFKKNDKSNI
jgi:hypothetical protein